MEKRSTDDCGIIVLSVIVGVMLWLALEFFPHAEWLHWILGGLLLICIWIKISVYPYDGDDFMY